MTADGTPEETDVPLFDVWVTLPSGMAAESFRDRLISEGGVAAEKVDGILSTLRRGFRARVGRSVSKERADRLQQRLLRIGLQPETAPVLALQALKPQSEAQAGSEVCPACQQWVVLLPNRQCPACEVFVDKVEDKFLLRKKILEQERSRLEARAASESRTNDKRNREALERLMRERIRAELEAEYGLKPEKADFFEGKLGLVRAVGGLVVLSGAVMLGRVSHQIPGLGNAPVARQGAAAVSAPAGSSGSGAVAAASAASAGMSAEVVALASKTAEEGLPQPTLAAGGDNLPLAGDSLLPPTASTARGAWVVEQAVAAATQLSKSAGVGSLEGALAKAQSAANAAAPTVRGLVSPEVSPPGGITAPAAALPGPVTHGGAAVILTSDLRFALAGEFLLCLAELGQAARAHEVSRALWAQPEFSSDPKFAAGLRLADVQSRAWAMGRATAGQVPQMAEALRNEIGRISNPSERAIALSRAGAILAKHTVVPSDLGKGLVNLAGELLQGLSGPQAAIAQGEWAVALADVLAADLAESARSGHWMRARALNDRLKALAALASTAEVAARLHGVEYRARAALGLVDELGLVLDSGISAAGKAGSVLERVRALRGVISASGQARHPRVQEATAQLQAQVDTLKGVERVQSKAELTLLYFMMGQRDKAARLREQVVQAASRLPIDESAPLIAEALVRGDLALARLLHAEAAYASAEPLLQRVASYLL